MGQIGATANSESIPAHFCSQSTEDVVLEIALVASVPGPLMAIGISGCLAIGISGCFLIFFVLFQVLESMDDNIR